jgi:hypothetical protein
MTRALLLARASPTDPLRTSDRSHSCERQEPQLFCFACFTPPSPVFCYRKQPPSAHLSTATQGGVATSARMY